uniref:Uncharacterized protein n=1 Tax=Candidatus Kentrum sp. MB TaxID=2138164 RepID=A0A451BFL4_9GAMM|nr:MAG: hypothetical protein BECKMB1821G_GA0114241_10273 [Candidatus Kentron sp. MB]VFK34938.1 MAG: hypothetical protein BECKMB1821I_GA0114274_10923 [Candidatus Kentron sp. MB]VFK77075.1 MAG: hypothetical protein BECKMB1821H_GA0114242_10973 [Candidatus Kentron sp. MB]
MSDLKTYYTAIETHQLTDDASGSGFGRAITHFEVRRFQDVSNLGSQIAYVVTMKQRVIIPNGTDYQPGPSSETAYTNYPAVLLNSLKLNINNNASVLLRGIFPKTLNSAVNTTQSASDSTGQSTSTRNTTGSTQTNVNTFGVGISGGFFGELPIGSLSAEYSHSWENSKMHSQSTGNAQDQSHNVSDGESMSIKDWSSYGYLDDIAVNPTWIWGQSYPWDVIQYNQTKDGTTIDLPTFVQDRLVNGSLILPPSQLSMFGLDFTMQAAWRMEFPKGISVDETLSIDFATSCYTASHQSNGSGVSATLQSAKDANNGRYASTTLNLSEYALNPLSGAARQGAAAIGFLANPFTFPPTSADASFKIVSPSNNLQVSGSGFDSVMTTTFSKPVKLRVIFKVTDTSDNYSLVLMHWIGNQSSACTLTCTINQKWKDVIYVDKTEGQGGQNNVSELELRNTDFTSINFHDYLLVGLNTIEIEVAPVSSGGSNAYTLFALAVSQE